MDYVYVIYYSDNADDDDIGGDITELIAAYQYEEDALAYIEHERTIAPHPRLAQYFKIEKLIFRV